MSRIRENPNCCGAHCVAESGEVRVLPIGNKPDHGNLIFCYACFTHEIRWRDARNKQLSETARFALPLWNDLKVYGHD